MIYVLLVFAIVGVFVCIAQVFSLWSEMERLQTLLVEAIDRIDRRNVTEDAVKPKGKVTDTYNNGKPKEIKTCGHIIKPKSAALIEFEHSEEIRQSAYGSNSQR